MNYESQIIVKDEKKELLVLFEKYNEKFDRSEVIITHSDDNLIIKVVSIDSVALRASLNTITKLFTTYEEMSKI